MTTPRGYFSTARCEGADLPEPTFIEKKVVMDETIIGRLQMLAKVTKASLKANREILKRCLSTDEEGRAVCRFCGHGIPNWRDENAREHVCDCPINLVAEALKLKNELKEDLLPDIPAGNSQVGDDR